ncbi:MAG: 50S ribosomal protein L3 [Halobacteriota archaeon]
MAKRHRPRRGSLAYSPRKRAKREVPRVRSWPEQSESRIQGFAGYKAGMTHTIIIDDRPNSPTEGMEISVPVTILETPPLKIAAIRAYNNTPYGRKVSLEEWASDLETDLKKLMPLHKGSSVREGSLDGAEEIRLLMYTLPKKVSGISKKVPDLMEMRVGAKDVKSTFEYAHKIIGKEVAIADIYKIGELVDVISITKGKGTQGPVKRWGVTIQDRKAFRGGKGRHIGNLGPWNPARVRWTVPQLGQTGYHQRTEFNKRIIKIGSNGSEVTPQGGLLKYGIVKGDYIMLKGSVPGPIKRLVRIRDAIRPSRTPQTAPELSYISLQSKQG